MNTENKNIDLNPNRSNAENNFFNKVEISYGKSKDEVWEMMATRLDEKTESRAVYLNPNRLWISLAAAILVLAGMFSILRFYSTTVHSPIGQHLTAMLPDGSVVELNAQTTLKFYPLWWQFSRELSLEGEAFFKVTKGKNFEINSAMGKTIVVGTSFNIFSRTDEYKVTCVSGKVKVVSTTKDEVILSPGYHAEVEQGGGIKVFKNYQTGKSISWRDEMFTFTASPLSSVIQEIERQYAVSITLNTQTAHYYTGFFSKKKPVEEVLDLLCKTFGLTFEKISDSKYQISEN